MARRSPPSARVTPDAHAAAGSATVVDLSDGSFIVSSAERHEHWPPKGELLSIKGVVSGRETFIVDGARYEIGSGRMLLIPEGVPYASRVGPGPVEMCPVFLSRTLATGMRLPDGPALLPRDEALSSHLAWLAAEVLRAAAGEERELDAGQALRIQSRLVLYLSRAARGARAWEGRLDRLGAKRRSTRLEVQRRLSRAEDRMRADPAAPLSLSDLAAFAGMSPFHFLRRFSELYGEPPHRFLVRIRMELARSLLRGSDRPLKSIASACGYRSVPTFIRTFRRQHGFTPKARCFAAR